MSVTKRLLDLKLFGSEKGEEGEDEMARKATRKGTEKRLAKVKREIALLESELEAIVKLEAQNNASNS